MNASGIHVLTVADPGKVVYGPTSEAEPGYEGVAPFGLPDPFLRLEMPTTIATPHGAPLKKSPRRR